MTSESNPFVEGLLSDFLARRKAGEEVGIEQVCAAHPVHAAALRSLWLTRRIQGESPRDFSFFGRGERADSVLFQAGLVRAGDDIGEFHLVELIDRGGQGEVWAAEQRSLDRRVALKLIRPERVSERSLALFQREARAGGRLSHAGIVAIHDHGVTGGHAWIAMELVEGAWTLRNSLSELASAERLPGDYYRRTAHLIALIADALQAAHEAGVIHRDVKPSNILITPEDQPKLTDFGLARITDEAALSATGDFAGTYFYMSPEQVAARRAGIDHRTDIFSLGVVTYELLSLHRPFTGESSHEVMDQILTVNPPDLHRVYPRIPRELAVICSKALAKARHERYQSMAELAADLRHFLNDEPIVARPPTARQRLARWVRKHPTRSAVVATLLVAASAFFLFYGLRRPAPAAPFTGPAYRRLLVADSPADERSPTFVGDRHLLFEHGPAQGGPPSLWQVDLGASLMARPWSPAGKACAAPAVSPDGRWLTYERPARDTGRTAIAVCPLEERNGTLTWPTEVHAVLEPPEGSVGGVRWGSFARFVYTHIRHDSLALMLHDMQGLDAQDLELARLPRGSFASTSSASEHIPACFSPDGERVLIAVGHALKTLAIEPDSHPATVRQLDCGSIDAPIWLADDSILFARRSFREASTRLHHLVGDRTVRLRELETRLLGGYDGLAVNHDQSMLALVTEINLTKLYLSSSPGEAPVELQTRYPPSHGIWSPEGELVYSGDSARAQRLFALDTETGRDRALELDVPTLAPIWSSLHLDQPAFSQEGHRLVLRAKGEPPNEVCDPGEWIVVAPWPLGSGQAVAVSIEGRLITFPHVSDAGDRLLWVERHPQGGRLFTADLEGDRVVRVEERMRRTGWPARLSGDGEVIAVPVAIDDHWHVQLLSWNGAVLDTLEDAGESHRPMWLPSSPANARGDAQLAYFHWDPGSPELWSVRGVRLETVSEPRELFSLPFPDQNPSHSSYGLPTGSVLYTIDHQEKADIWLIRPNREGEEP